MPMRMIQINHISLKKSNSIIAKITEYEIFRDEYIMTFINKPYFRGEFTCF